ncbi:MAG: endolytic transglycosylase MltG [Jatrophihabitantaceae bacterium]
MTQRDESLADHDPHSLLFGHDDEDGHGSDHANDHHGDRAGHSTRSARRRARQDRAHHVRRRRNRRVLVILSLLVVVVVGVSAWLIVPKVIDLFSPPDYSGSGSGSVSITVATGDTAADIGATLLKDGVVESTKAFTDAASGNAASQNIQPGTYTLRKHMSAKSALNLLLNPKSRNAAGDLAVTEGATTFDVLARLVQILGPGKRSAIVQALDNASALGFPLGYAPKTGKITSTEGFLYPATYSIDPTGSIVADLQRMLGKFAEHDRATGFAADAAKLKLTPYGALIIASIAQSEARFPADMAKVARVILNRMAIAKPLQIDATSVYGAKVLGLDPTKVVFSQIDSPYNSYTHAGLPPTPISNPGPDALDAAVHPTAGDWTYYVNGDQAGHLYFTNSATAFQAAQQKCYQNNWGCAAP